MGNYLIAFALIVGLGTILTVLTNARATRRQVLEDASCHSCSTGGCNSCNFDTLKDTLSKDSSNEILLNPIKK
jgi:hypothetical protein